jgi:RPA family protein
MKKIIYNPENPNGIEMDLTAEEIAQKETDLVNFETIKQAEETAKQIDATNKANGNQKLLDLGLSQAEATALTGYTPPVE